MVSTSPECVISPHHDLGLLDFALSLPAQWPCHPPCGRVTTHELKKQKATWQLPELPEALGPVAGASWLS